MPKKKYIKRTFPRKGVDWDSLNKIIECCICKTKIKDIESNNAEPINNGRCCTDCNLEKVIPKRLSQL
tara:strand:- start:702 stop:905 length:204 start_codon:yes stop_codon:yes gene_type:complete